MRIALLADIHANLEALLAVTADAEGQQVDEFLCAGDLVDYGPNPEEVINKAIANNFITVMGNHDYGVAFDLAHPEFKVAKGRNLQDELTVLNWTQRSIRPANKKYLASLPRLLLLDKAGFRILLTHALPDDLNAYIGPGEPEKLNKLRDNYKADIYVLGHLHIPYRDTSTGALIINPGSVGKPKDENPDASYAVLDLGETASVEFRRVKYDIESVISKMNKNRLPEPFAKALRSGK